jgi:seryl-tRNA(Sec) selenium transferase
MSFLSRALSRLLQGEDEDEFKKTLRELDRMAKEAVREQELVIKGKRRQPEWTPIEEESVFSTEEFYTG